MVQIIYYRDKCIGCSSCSDIDPGIWTIDDADGKSNLEGASQRRNNIYVLNSYEADYFLTLEVSDSCPVGIIEVKEL